MLKAKGSQSYPNIANVTFYTWNVIFLPYITLGATVSSLETFFEISSNHTNYWYKDYIIDKGFWLGMDRSDFNFSGQIWFFLLLFRD